MPTINIGGQKVKVGDGFLKMSPDEQNAAVEEIAASLPSMPAPEAAEAPETPISANDLVRSTATGVPVIGGALNQLNAVTNAALAPILNPLFDEKDQLKGSFGERRARSLELQNAQDKKFSEEHPIVDTAAKFAGGVGAMVPAVMAAPAAFGAVGTLPQMVKAGTMSGAALSAADAAVRGEDVAQGAGMGAAFGAGGPLVGRAAGKIVDAFRKPPPAAPLPQNTTTVAGVDVPFAPHQVNADPAEAAAAEAMRRGAQGEGPQAAVQSFDELQAARIKEASSKIAESLDPAAARAGTAPQEAGQAVIDDLVAAEARRFGTEQNAVQRAAAEGAALRPAGVLDPAAAAEQVGAGVAGRREAARQHTRDAYGALRETEGTFSPDTIENFASDLRTRLAMGAEPVTVNPQTTAQADQALRLMDSLDGTGLFRHRAPRAAPVGPIQEARALSQAEQAVEQLVEQGVNRSRAEATVRKMFGGDDAVQQVPRAAGQAGPEVLPGVPRDVSAPVAGARAPVAADVPVGGGSQNVSQRTISPGETPPIPEVGLREMDEARKRLVTMYGDARRAAMGPGGTQADVRAMGSILREFDNAVLEAFENGRFSGDGETAARLLRDARASHAFYRERFTSRGPGDEIGRSVEKILGRYADSAASPDEIARLSYGSMGDPGGGKAARVSQRLRTILGESSPEWGAYKQGLVSHLIDTPPGTSPRTASQTADRIEKFLDGANGRVLAEVALTPAERTALRNYAGSLRASEPVPIGSTQVDKIVARLSGRDGGPPATANDAINYLMGSTGKGNKSVSVQLAQQLKRTLEPETWTSVRQGMWEKLINAGEGKIPFEAQALSQRISEFLNESGKGLAHVIYTPAERAEMAKLAQAYRRMVPLKGTTNPSGSGWAVLRAAKSASDNLGALLGLAGGGLPGAVMGAGAQAGAKKLLERRATREAERLVFGDQPKRPGRRGSALTPIVLGQELAVQQ